MEETFIRQFQFSFYSLFCTKSFLFPSARCKFTEERTTSCVNLIKLVLEIETFTPTRFVSNSKCT